MELSTHCGQNYLDTWFLHVYIDRFECNYMSIIKPGLWCWTQSQSYQYIIWTYPFFRILGVFQSYCKYYFVVCKLSCLLCLFIIQFLLLTPVYCFTFTVSVSFCGCSICGNLFIVPHIVLPPVMSCCINKVLLSCLLLIFIPKHMCCPTVQNPLFLTNVFEKLLKAEYFCKHLKQPGVICLLAGMDWFS